VKHYTKHNLKEVKGPITLVSGKNRRLTFFECGNDMVSMIDIAKVADLVLLLVDASFGFEMVFSYLFMIKFNFVFIFHFSFFFFLKKGNV